MDILKFKALDGIDLQTEIHYRLITSIKNTSGPHTHDFYEFFLILEGKAIHCINDEKHTLEQGALVFIRPGDVHYYEPVPGTDFQFINLSFYKETIYALFSYLGEGFAKQDLLDLKTAPKVNLTINEIENIKIRLEYLNLIPNFTKSIIRTQGRAIIAEIFSMYFLNYKEYNLGKLPDLMNNLCSDMKKKQNFTLGLPALLSLSGRTHEHLCRLFKKHLGITPTEYINDLRLNYAENLLLNSDIEIIQVCYNSGFNNLSYFYKLFKKRFNTTPYDYRKKIRENFKLSSHNPEKDNL